MTKFILILATSLILVSCEQNQQKQRPDKNGSIVMDTVGNAHADKKLKAQIEEYLIAFNTGDADKALYYVYPDIFEYLKKQYPDEEFNMQEIKDTIFIEPIKKMKKLVKEKKIEFEFEVGEITRKVNYHDSKLYMVMTYVNAKIGLNKHSLGGEVIAISNDNGENWKFVQNDPETINGILRIKFPQNIVDKLISKE